MTNDARAVTEAVKNVLATDNWPIYRTQDDNGLEYDQYLEFALAVFAAAATARTPVQAADAEVLALLQDLDATPAPWGRARDAAALIRRLVAKRD